jgi:hypothetical protein
MKKVTLIFGASGQYGRMISEECYRRGEYVFTAQREADPKRNREDDEDYFTRWYKLDLTDSARTLAPLMDIVRRGWTLGNVYNFSRVSYSAEGEKHPYDMCACLRASCFSVFHLAEVAERLGYFDESASVVIPFGDTRTNDFGTTLCERLKVPTVQLYQQESLVKHRLKLVKLPVREKASVETAEKVCDFAEQSSDTLLDLTQFDVL